MGVASYNIFLPIFFKHLKTLNLGSTYHLPLQHCIEHINRRPFANNSYPHISPLTYLLVMKLLKCNIVTNWTCFGKIIKGKKKWGLSSVWRRSIFCCKQSTKRSRLQIEIDLYQNTHIGRFFNPRHLWNKYCADVDIWKWRPQLS